MVVNKQIMTVKAIPSLTALIFGRQKYPVVRLNKVSIVAFLNQILLFIGGKPEKCHREDDCKCGPCVSHHEDSSNGHTLDESINTVTTMVHDQTQWAARSNFPRLFPVHIVQRIIREEPNTEQED